MIPGARTDELDQPPPTPAPGLVMTPGECAQLLPLAVKDLLDTLNEPFWRGNPAKPDEWTARNRRLRERKLQRVNELYRAWLDHELEVHRPCAS